MSVLTASTEFAKALAPLLWPVVVIVIFLSARTKIYALLNRQTVSVKVGGFELNVADATQSIGESVADLQQRLSNLEVRLAGEGGTAGPGMVANLVTRAESDDRTDAPKGPYSILWADDNPAGNAFLIQQFSGDGIHVETALTTKEAVSMFGQMKPDLVITDLGRREGNVSNAYAGLGLIKQIRSSDLTTPIVVFATQRAIDNRDKLIAAGATAVFRSGVDLQTFISNRRGNAAPAA